MRKIWFLFLILAGYTAMAQNTPTCYRISLSDKNNSPYSISNPSVFLSQRALDKRARFNIAITEQDFPVNPQYIQQIKAIDANIQVLCTSKWMNTVTIYCPDSTKPATISALPFVTNVLPVADYDLQGMKKQLQTFENNYVSIVSNPAKDSMADLDYGEGYRQIALHNGHLLHKEGFLGNGMLIVVFDAGWSGVDTSAYFHPLFENSQIWGTRDLIPGHSNVFNGHYHGTIVTSTMAILTEGTLVGTAPKANYFFIRSEHPVSEELIEEDFWAQAAEIADSLGADVVNSSLGYTTFRDFPQGDFTYEDMDGVTSIASRAATILGQKGVVVCVSAGNEGTSPWYHIGHPADAFDILAVGAANVMGHIAGFSSRGPSYDGRVKPDITSVGVNTTCIWPDDRLGEANGTSLACPVAAGLCACLWQALPEKTASEIMQIVRESSSCYNNPNDSLGYGIPDFYAAYQNHAHDGVPEHIIPSAHIFPNPCTNQFNISSREDNIDRVELFSIDGKLVLSTCPDKHFYISVNVQDVPAGFYIGRIYLKNKQIQTFRIIKQ
ncbi:MAG: S8 family peptidase [Bacteroidales bacterium]|nr:S8 family peptidase [Bacteroidales bacterium]